MVGDVEIEVERLRRVVTILLFGDISSLHHLLKHHIATVAASVGIAHWIIIRRILAQSYQCSCLIEGEVLRFLTKICVRGGFYAHCIMQEVEVVEIHGNDLVLGVELFDLHRNNPLDWFLQRTFHHTVCLARIELLGKLLGDGRSTTGIQLPQESALDESTPQCIEINARVVIESHVLGGNKRLDNIRGEFVVIHTHTILLVVIPGSHQLSVGREHLSGKTVDRVLQVLDWRHISNLTLGNRPKRTYRSQDNHHKHGPKEVYECLSHCLMLNVEYLILNVEHLLVN